MNFDGSFERQLRLPPWHLLLLRWRPEGASIQLMVKTTEGNWSHVDDWFTDGYHHPEVALGLLRRNPRLILRRLGDRCDQHSGPLEDHVSIVLNEIDAGSFTAQGVT